MVHSARLVIFCGKGGVGKTTLSLAAGLKYAAGGHRVLVISSHPLGELALAVSLEHLSERFPEAASRLFVIHIDPRDLISELVRKHFPVTMVAERILSSTIFANLVEIAPGLKEFFFLGRLQELAERRYRESAAVPEFDYLIWDAPATGHFLGTLRSARGFDVFLTGPLATAGEQMHRFFAGNKNIQLFPVTSPEEMAIAETLELVQAMASDFGVCASAVMVNCASPVCGAPEAVVEGFDEGAAASDALRFAILRGRMERERCAALRTTLPVPQMLIPRITHWSNDLDLLARIGSQMDFTQFA